MGRAWHRTVRATGLHRTAPSLGGVFVAALNGLRHIAEKYASEETRANLISSN
jgi:hypothetical protein